MSHLTVNKLDKQTFLGIIPISKQDEDYIQTIGQLENIGYDNAYSVKNNKSQVVFACGYFEYDSKCYDTWTIFTDNWSPAYYRELVGIVKEYISNMDFLRIQHAVIEDREYMGRFLGMAGFEFEGNLRKFRNGLDHHIYAIVRT